MEFMDSTSGVILPIEDCGALTRLEQSTLVDDHYEINLPWRADSLLLPDNPSVVLWHPQTLHIRLQEEPRLLARYSIVVCDYTEKSYAKLALVADNVRLDGTHCTIQFFGRLNAPFLTAPHGMHRVLQAITCSPNPT
ncbi:hypothetical protein PHET_03483 [Paragonimus heterotremus]|uniref:Uncharacterized protein n=1 Tax=Paragonimus heterotremus TaxID=100268 RepID=A0A8J4TNH6_9TREM|nr:hypothetical protein PHET_03483 [Paragonimus heterotremus]